MYNLAIAVSRNELVETVVFIILIIILTLASVSPSQKKYQPSNASLAVKLS